MNKIKQLVSYRKMLRYFGSLLFMVSGLVPLLHAQAPVTVVIGNTAGTGNWFFGPIYRNTNNSGTLNYSRHAYLYTSAELATAGIPSGAKIVKVEWLKKDGGSIAANNNFNVWMNNTTTATFPSTATWSSLETGSTQVYSSTTYSIPTTTNTYIAAPFNLPPNDSFTYSGSNLMIMTDWAKLGVQTGNGINFYVSTATGKAIGIASTTPMTGASVLQAATYGNSRPTIRITYVPVPGCSGVPTTGAALSSTATACAGVNFTLTIQNTIPGTGLSYVWERADDAAFTQNVAPIGTAAALTISESASSYYRCTATCINSGLTNTSTPVYVPLSPHYLCYCSSIPLSPADEDIFNVTFGSLNNSSNCTSTAAGPGSAAQQYSNYQYITPPNVEKESVVPFSVTIGTCLNTYPNRTAIYIDYNQNGVFESNEQVYATAFSISGAHVESGSITIPATALTGLTGMRVITSEQGIPITTACLQYSFGETEDYLINITPTTQCSGAPVPGNTISSLTSVCSGKNVNLSLQNLTTGQGVSYQWYANNVAVSGATNFAFTSGAITSPTTFYCAVTCTNSGLTTNSNPVTITLESFKNCYCVSMPGGDADEDIFDFTFNGTQVMTDCNNAAPGPGSILGRYSNFHPLGSIDTVFLGQKVPFVMNSDDCDQAPYYSFGTAIWIDFNQNGSFSDPGEMVYVENVPLEGPRSIMDSVKIPCSALEGQTGMRITIAESYAGGLISPCMLYGFGETEDYLIYIKQADTCGFTPLNKAGNVQATVAYFCDSTITTVSMQNKCFFNNYTYQWYKNNVAIPGATNVTYTSPMLYNSTTYSCIVTCNNNGTITHDTTAPLTILKSIPTVNVNATSNMYCTGSVPVTLVSTGALFYSYSPSSGLSSASGQIVNATPSATTTYTVTGVNSHGCSNTSVVTIGHTSLPVDLTASGNSYCYPTGNAITLTATAPGNAQFQYTPSAGLSTDTGSVVIATPPVTTTYYVTGIDSAGCTGSDSLTITVVPCTTTLNMKLYIQGYYDAAGYMKPVLMNQGIGSSSTVTDSILVELHDSLPPYGLVHSKTVLLHTDGTAVVDFPAVFGSYYIAVRHRNAMETWSANPVNVSTGYYDFSSAASQAYGDNQIQMEPGLWAFYVGDLNLDNNADLIDEGILEAAQDAFAFGYKPSDLNGDGNVDLLDSPILELNVANFVFSARP